MATKIAVLILLLIAGCGAIGPTVSGGRYLTIEHGSARFGDAVEGARQYCSSQGLGARHLGTDRGGYLMMSRFECI